MFLFNIKEGVDILGGGGGRGGGGRGGARRITPRNLNIVYKLDYILIN
jgi:hypothetical protein